MNRPTFAGLVVAAVAAGTVLVTASPALAWVAPTRVSATSPTDLTVVKSVEAGCPLGTVVIGVGGTVNFGQGGVALTGIVAGVDLSKVTAYAVASPTHKAPWSVAAHAVCHNPAEQAPELVIGAPGASSSSAVCPAGKVTYASGFRIVAPMGGTVLTSLVPTWDMDRVDATTRGSGGAVVAQAICAYPLQSPYFTHLRTDNPTALSPISPKIVAAGKPDRDYDWGTWMVSAGGAVSGSDRAFIDGLWPDETLEHSFARGVLAPTSVIAPKLRQAQAAGGDDFALTTYGVCIGSWY